MRLLLDKNAEIESVDSSCQTLLPDAAKDGYEAVVRLLQLYSAQSLSPPKPGR